MKHYLVCPDDSTDAVTLINLYQVNPRDCLINHPDRHLYRPLPDGLIQLVPQSNGDYSLSEPSTPGYIRT